MSDGSSFATESRATKLDAMPDQILMAARNDEIEAQMYEKMGDALAGSQLEDNNAGHYTSESSSEDRVSPGP